MQECLADKHEYIRARWGARDKAFGARSYYGMVLVYAWAVWMNCLNVASSLLRKARCPS